MYKEIAERALKDSNPKEYRRLQLTRKLQPYLESLEEEYGEEFLRQMKQVMKENEGEKDFRKREQAIEGAKFQIREVLASQLAEQVSAQPAT